MQNSFLFFYFILFFLNIRFDQHCSYRLFQCPFLFRLQALLFTSPLKTPYEDVHVLAWGS